MVIKQSKLNWVKVDPENPETKFGTTDEFQWSLDVLVDGETAQKWVDDGFAQKRKAVKDMDGVYAIKLKRPTIWKKSGKAKSPVKVIDMFGDPINPATIGNGTIANVQYSTFEWEYAGKKGRSAELQAIQVIELQKYEGNGSQGDEFSFTEKEIVDLDDNSAFD